MGSRRREWEEKDEEDDKVDEPTDLNHVVFGVAASSKLWKQTKEYIKIRYAWLDKEVKKTSSDEDDDVADDDKLLPPVKIFAETTSFTYTNKQGQRLALRISRIVSGTLRLGLKRCKTMM